MYTEYPPRVHKSRKNGERSSRLSANEGASQKTDRKVREAVDMTRSPKKEAAPEKHNLVVATLKRRSITSA